MSTNKKIKRVLNKIVGRIDIRNKEDRDWYNDVRNYQFEEPNINRSHKYEK